MTDGNDTMNAAIRGGRTRGTGLRAASQEDRNGFDAGAARTSTPPAPAETDMNQLLRQATGRDWAYAGDGDGEPAQFLIVGDDAA